MDKICAHCGKTFFTLLMATRYCSTKCRWDKWATKEKAAKPIFSKKCKWCGTEFTSTYKDKLYCTRKCCTEYINHQRKPKKILPRVCPQCNVSFQPLPKSGVGSTYCSEKCKNKFNYHKVHTSIKERRAAWQKKNKWGGNWEAALTRDHYTCQVCNKQSYPSQWSKNIALEVHHKDGSGETGDKNHSLDNLQTLCRSCHKEFHTKISLIEVDGVFYIRGDIFKRLGIVMIATVDSDNSNAWYSDKTT